MKKFILFAIAFAAIVSCAKESPLLEENPSENLMEVSLLAYAPGSEVESDTKSVLADNGVSVLWEDGDQIKVAFPPRGSSGNSDPKTEVSFTLTASLAENSAQAYFLANISDLTKYNAGYAFYPTSTVFSSSRNGYTITNAFSYDLASVQTEGFGAYNLASSYVDNNHLANHNAKAVFLNACALIRIVLPEGVNDVVSIKVESNNSKALAGNANLELTTIKGIGLDINGDGSLNNNDYSYRLTSPTFSDGGSPEVTLTNGGEAFVPGIEYNIVTWPGTHSNGLTFTFTTSDGGVCEKSVSSNVVLEASKFDKFNFKSAFDFVYQYHVTEEIQEAALLENGKMYIAVLEMFKERCWTNSGDDLVLTSLSSDDPFANEYGAEHVFVFNKKESTLYGADKYNSKTAATWMSLSTEKYIGSDLNIKADSDNALEFVIANLWSGNVGARMDVWRNASGDKQYLYYGSYGIIGTASVGVAESAYGQEGRKWRFYEVEPIR